MNEWTNRIKNASVFVVNSCIHFFVRSFIHSFLRSFIHSFIHYSSLRQVHSLLQSEFPRQRDIVFPLSYSNIFSSSRLSSSCLRLLSRHLLRSTLPSIKCFRRHFLRKLWIIHLAFNCFIFYTLFFSFQVLCNTSFFTILCSIVNYMVAAQNYIVLCLCALVNKPSHIDTWKFVWCCLLLFSIC